MRLWLHYLIVSIVAGMLHFVWEWLHIPLYNNYDVLGSGWELTLWATAGDVLYTLLILALVALIRGDPHWIQQPKENEYLAAGLLGGLVACMVEYKALAFHRWAYAAAMPIVPVLGIGLSPLLQMILLTPAALYIATKLRVYSV